MKSLFTLGALVLMGAVSVTPSLAAPAAPAPKGASAADSQYPYTGKVLETIDTDLYTYIEVAGMTDKEAPVWLAASKSKVAKGDTIRYGNGAEMTNFHSKTLNRTFPSIIFIEKVQLVK